MLVGRLVMITVGSWVVMSWRLTLAWGMFSLILSSSWLMVCVLEEKMRVMICDFWGWVCHYGRFKVLLS